MNQEKLSLEQAAEAFSTGNHKSSFADTAEYNAFIAGAKFREAQLMDIVESLKLFLEYVAKTDISENTPDFLWLNEWRNHRKQLAQNTLTSVNKALDEMGIG